MITASFNKLIDNGTGPNARHGYLSMYRMTGGAWSTYALISASGADDLLTTSMGVGDGIDFFVPNNGFSPKHAGVQFNISQAVVGIGLTFAYEYRKADGTWAPLSGVVDGTSGFTLTGLRSITFTVPSDWGSNSTSVCGVVGALHWRARIASGTITTNARKAATQQQHYNYAISLEDNSDYDSGTATSGSSNTLTDSTKSFSTDSLRYRIIYVHSGTGAGQRRIIIANTATTITIVGYWETIPDSTSQYSILANMEDLYNADVSAGWGKITKTGRNSYFVNCNLEIWLAGFGSILDTVEFGEGFTYTQRPSSSTSRYIQQFGYLNSVEHGQDATIAGSTWVTNHSSTIDIRSIGFRYGDYSYLYGNNFVNRFWFNYVSTSHIRFWFYNRANESVNNRFSGFRSVEYGYSSCKSRRDEISFGHSGVENPLARFVDARAYFNNKLNVFFTGSATQVFDDSLIGLPMNPSTDSPINEYNYTNTSSKILDPKGFRMRPVGDIWSATSNGILSVNRTFRIAVDDENGNLVNGVRCIVKNSQGTVVHDRISGQTILSSTSVSNNGTYTVTNQPSVPDRLRLTFSSYVDTGGSANAARMVIYGTDKNGDRNGEQIFLENIGNHVIWTQNEYASVTSIKVYGFSATLSIDRNGSFGRMEVVTETWQSLNDSTLTNLVDYNPFTIKLSRQGFQSLEKKIYVFDSKREWILGMKRSKLIIN